MIKVKVELEFEAENMLEVADFFATLSKTSNSVTSTAVLTSVETTKTDKPAKLSKAEKQQQLKVVDQAPPANSGEAIVDTPPAETKPVETKPTETKSTGTKLINEDGTPLTKENEIDDARAYLRSIAKPANEAGHIDEIRAAVASLGGAKSITLMDPKYFPELEKKIREIHPGN